VLSHSCYIFQAEMLSSIICPDTSTAKTWRCAEKELFYTEDGEGRIAVNLLLHAVLITKLLSVPHPHLLSQVPSRDYTLRLVS